MDKMDILEWLTHLVAFDTTSRHSNLELIHYLQHWFLKQGINCRLTYNTEKNKANLLAILPDHQGNETNGLVLSGHTDVVPIDGQTWHTNPFQLKQIGQKLFGRGTADMKGFLAVALATIPMIQKEKLLKPIYFAFSYDEEIGCRGVPELIKDMQQIQLNPTGCLVGEPTEMHPIVAHKGIQVLRVSLQGLAAHSSLTPFACNAVEYAADLVKFIRSLAEEIKNTDPLDNLFDVPFSTLSTNLIKGGNAYNTVPADCEFVFEYRHLAANDPQKLLNKIKNYIKDDLLPRMRKEYDNAKVNLEIIAAAPAFAAEKDNSFMQIIDELCQPKSLKKVAYATEAGLFQAADIPTIVLGPGSIQEAHKANEFITIEQLLLCRQFLEKLIKNFCLASS